MASKYRILVADELSEQGLDILRQAPDVDWEQKTGLKGEALGLALQGAVACIVRSATKITAEALAQADQLKVIGRAGSGVDNIDVPAAAKKNIIVMNVPSGNTISTAEHALAMMFALARRIPQATASMKANKWEKKLFAGAELFEKTLGIVGLGRVGRAVAERAVGLKMRVIASDPAIQPDLAKQLGVELVSLNQLLERADVITVHANLNDSTRNLIGQEQFQRAKKGVYLINCARGGIVDETALLEALNSGKVAGAALDALSQEPPPADFPLVQHPNVICTPHLGASTAEAQVRVAVEIVRQILDYLREGKVRNAVKK